MSGETKTRGFEVYKSVLDALGEYIDVHKGIKIRDIVSRALSEYIKKHK